MDGGRRRKNRHAHDLQGTWVGWRHSKAADRRRSLQRLQWRRWTERWSGWRRWQRRRIFAMFWMRYGPVSMAPTRFLVADRSKRNSLTRGRSCRR
uniref:Uncharacterized protein n=1 Tax=Arundo donax TaxID=35708 RepID=A0A0A9HGF0_ARUDO